MGDKSPKSKQKNKDQKAAGKDKKKAAARAKQDRQGQSPPITKGSKK